MQDVSSRQLLSVEPNDSIGLSCRSLLSIEYEVRVSVSLSIWYLQCGYSTDVVVGLQRLYGRVVLWVYGSDAGDGSLCGGVLLRRGLECVSSVPLPLGQHQLLGRDVCVRSAWHSERHLSGGSLLSRGLLGACAMSSGHELILDGSAEGVGLSVLSSGLLLSEERDGVGDS